MDLNLRTGQIEPVARKAQRTGRQPGKDDLMALVLAAILENRPGKCAVIDARHLPGDCTDFATDTY